MMIATAACVILKEVNQTQNRRCQLKHGEGAYHSYSTQARKSRYSFRCGRRHGCTI